MDLKKPGLVSQIGQIYDAFSKIELLLGKFFPFVKSEFDECVKIVDNSMTLNIFEKIEKIEDLSEINYIKISTFLSFLNEVVLLKHEPWKSKS